VETVAVGDDPVLPPGDGDDDVALGVDVGVPVPVPDVVGELAGVEDAGEGGGAEYVGGGGAGVRGIDRAGALADGGRIRK
jgi:hypothetical protein